MTDDEELANERWPEVVGTFECHKCGEVMDGSQVHWRRIGEQWKPYCRKPFCEHPAEQVSGLPMEEYRRSGLKVIAGGASPGSRIVGLSA